ncbi:MAG: hypothetical protein HRT45_17250 [Bdellovibrionales bacterium]|nr:hypothetical protein [Bdellovibrionales bacterium]
MATRESYSLGRVQAFRILLISKFQTQLWQLRTSRRLKRRLRSRTTRIRINLHIKAVFGFVRVRKKRMAKAMASTEAARPMELAS